ncbi:hypothetical protein TTHERM_00326760 (macronuclear) [Tetrahymena thermophila SB210]|uniref:Uncharacterized protein n=1 Tax=Tetrahymena thermophila (strain SB210) TaxID=312017 RepID=I7LXU1_TETTS|nr:hypothetical protein TTHERM_00326760 [Tetrahymena thermophila SB210]EAS06194.1 hypothetical protein TTHERM_00326760 [Tetrahymena thermophila SB210]|eukprot:XP_001026439.1 hypothetical protein TTHERM_00326760 [Tetrahymena thermophila SB210]
MKITLEASEKYKLVIKADQMVIQSPKISLCNTTVYRKYQLLKENQWKNFQKLIEDNE